MTFPTISDILIWASAGLLLGTVYLRIVSRSVNAIVLSASWRAALGHLLLRGILAAVVFALAAAFGTAPLLLTLAGFLLARTVAVLQARVA